MEDGANLIAETCERVFRDSGADPQDIVMAPAGGGAKWRDTLWSALEETGLTTAWAPEEAGGGGASIREGFEILYVAGRHAVAVPLADTLVAAHLLARAGLSVPAGKVAVAPDAASDAPIALQSDGTLSGVAPRVPYARGSSHLVVHAMEDAASSSGRIALVELASCNMEKDYSLAGDALDRVVLDGVRPAAVGETPLSALEPRLFGAASRAMLIAGALQAILDLSVAYSLERVAFERPIAKFQAVQQNLAQLAGEVAAANAVVHSAAYALENGEVDTDAVMIEVASAKVRAGEAAQAGALIAHQVHGAIGYAREHVLHRFTHRLWAWRDEYGDESEWALRLGRHFTAQGADEMWPALTAI